ncbi:hypothetical protein ACG7TL_002096 [Trametes sanguinea]
MHKKAYRRYRETTEEDIAFSQMVPAGAFDVEVLLMDPQIHGGYTYRRVVFRKGDDVVLNSDFDDTEDVWIGRISQIRCNDRQEVMVKVCWYWSRNDVAKEIKSFRTSQCAPYERVLSDHYDYISPYAFQAVVVVHEYDERSLDPPMLGPCDLFVRTQFMHRKKAFKPPLGAETCICQVAYNPFPSSTPLVSSEGMDIDSASLSENRDVMHFCPSLNCRKWYHTSCLLASNNLDLLPAQTHGLRLLAVTPDEEALFATFEYFYEQESAEDMSNTDQVSLQKALVMLDRSPEIVTHLPPSLLAVAQLPIVRSAGAPHGFAIGNVADVVLARRLVYDAIQNSGDPACTNTFLEILARTEAFYRAPFTPPATHDPTDAAFWASLQTAISPHHLESEQEFAARVALVGEELEGLGLLATPYAPYWERREQEYRQLEALFTGPSFVCPQCRGCI